MDNKYFEVQLVTIKSELIDENKRKDYEERGYDIDTCFLLPFKLKDRFETLVHVLRQFTDDSNTGKTLGICDRLDFEMKNLCRSLEYLTNSTSYRKGNKYYEFDRREIDRKLGRKRGK